MKTIESVVLAFLFNASWQIALIAAAAAVASRMLKRFPALPRHAVWVAALMIALLLPAAQIAGRRSRLAKKVPAVSQPLPMQPTVNQNSVDPASAFDTAASPAAGRSAASNPANWRRDLQVGQKLAFAVIALYAGVMLWRLGCLALAWNRARMLAKRAQFVKMDARLRDVLSACARAFPRRNVSLFTSTEIAAPATIGWLRPRILLPEQLLLGSDADSLTAAIGHEMAHIARRDYLLNLVCEFFYVPLAFQPVAAFVRGQIRRTRELRCDELVAEHLMQPKNYARALVEMAQSAAQNSRPLTLAVGMSDGDILEERILSTLRRDEMKVPVKSSLLALAAVAFVAPCILAAPLALGVAIDSQDSASATAAKASAVVSAPPASGELQSGNESADPQVVVGQREHPVGWKTPDNKSAGYGWRTENSQAIANHAEQNDSESLEARRKREQIELAAGQAEKQKLSREQTIEQLQGMIAETEAKLAHSEQSGENLDMLRRRLEELRSKLTSIQNGEGLVERNEKGLFYEGGEGNEVMARDRRAFEQLAQQLQQAEQNYSDNSPQVKQLQAQLAQAKVTLEQDSANFQREREEQMKQRQLELAGKAKISMSDAIQIALQSHPGTVMQCALRSERDMIFYNVGIFGDVAFSNNDAIGKPMTTTVKTVTSVLVDAVDGHIIQPERGELKMERH